MRGGDPGVCLLHFKYSKFYKDPKLNKFEVLKDRLESIEGRHLKKRVQFLSRGGGCIPAERIWFGERFSPEVCISS